MPDNQNKDTTVTITIDTGSVNQSNKNTKITFTDDRSDAAENPGDPANYISTVSSGRKLTFQAVVKDPSTFPDDRVEVKKVTKKTTGGGEAILKNDSYDDTNGVVVCHVRDNKIPGTEQYTVKVKVVTSRGSGNGRVMTPSEYDVDPKLQMNT